MEYVILCSDCFQTIGITKTIEEAVDYISDNCCPECGGLLIYKIKQRERINEEIL